MGTFGRFEIRQWHRLRDSKMLPGLELASSPVKDSQPHTQHSQLHANIAATSKTFRCTRQP